MFIIGLAGPASRRSGRLSSNVSRHNRAPPLRINRRLGSFTLLAAFSGFALLGCTPKEQVTSAAIQEARTHATAFRADFESTAELLISSPIVWSDGRKVRYKSADTYSTDDLNKSTLPLATRERLAKFMTERRVGAVFRNDQRVNFVLFASGMAISGRSIGILVSPEQSHSCERMTSQLSAVNQEGLECEKLGARIYLYSQ